MGAGPVMSAYPWGMRVRLAPGVEPQRAISLVAELAGGTAAALGVHAENPVDKRSDYIRWATNTEAQLASVLQPDDARAFFAGPRHRDIASSAPGEHLATMIYAEIEANRRDLEDATGYLRAELARAQRAPGLPIVVDSNVLLQGQPIQDVKWVELLKSEVRLMMPLRVIEEIDAKKYSGSDRLRKRARTVLPWVNRLFPDGHMGPVRLAPDATIEVVRADRPRYRPDDADEEILDVCQSVARFAGRGKLMTADTGMRLRALMEGLDVFFWTPKEADESNSA